MSLTLWEFKKILKRRGIIIIIILLSIVNIYNITANFQDQRSDAYWSIYKELRGSFTEDKINFVMEHYNEYQEIIASGIYETETPNSRYYTGFVYGDFYEFSFHREEMERIFTYNDTIQAVKNAATENIELYNSKGNQYEKIRNEEISKIYGTRNLLNYFDTEGISSYLSYDFSSLLIIMVLLFAISLSFTGEKELDMDVIIQTCKNGAHKTVFAKKHASLIFAVIVSLYFYILDYICFMLVAHLDGLSAPIYQLKQYAFCPLSMNVWQFCLFSLLIKISGCCIFTMLFIFVSSVSSEIILSFSVNAGISFFLIGFADSSWSVLNPISFLSNIKYFNSLVTLNFFGYPIRNYILIFLFGTVEFIFFYLIVHKTYTSKITVLKRIKYRRRKNR